MPNRTRRLLRARFKGILFFVRSEDLSAFGQKWVQHDYPKSSGRYMEAQGRKPLDLSIDIFFSGDDWQQRFTAFRRVAEDPAPGRLVMPTFGVFENVVIVDPSANATQTAVGEISVSATFTQTIERPSPTSVLVTSQDVAAGASSSRAGLQETFTADYETPTSLENVQTADSDLRELGSEVESSAGNIRETQRFLRDVSGKVRNAATIAGLILSQDSPLGYLETLAGTITGAEPFGFPFALARVGSSLSNSINDITAGIQPSRPTTIPQEPGAPINSDVPVWDDDTAQRRQRNRNRLTIANTFRLFGLIEMFESAALRSYTTTDQVDEVVGALNSQYSFLVDNDTTGVVVPGMKNALDILRGLTLDALRRKRQNAFRVVEISLEKDMPDTLLAYELYGERLRNEDDMQFMAELLSGLNTQQARHRMSGTVRVVEIG